MLVFHWWTVAIFPEMLPNLHPLRPSFLAAFGGLERKSDAEQRRIGRDLLSTYLLGRGEELPLRAW